MQSKTQFRQGPVNGEAEQSSGNAGYLSALLERPVIWTFCALAVAFLQIALVLTHDAFVDEWQALQIAVQTPDISSLLANLRYESHPFGWYIFLRGLAAVFGPYNALQAASLICGLFTLWVILLRSPFPHWARLALALSPPLLFEFVAVSRGHTLGLAMFMGVMAAWRHPRLVWLPIALLPTVDFLYGVASLAFVAWRWRERGGEQPGWWWPGVAGWAILSLLSAWSIIPAEDYIPVYGATNGEPFHLLMALIRLSIVYVPIQGNLFAFDWSAGPPDPLMLTCWAILFLTMFDITRGRPVARAALFGTAALMFAFSAFLYPLQNRHVWVLGLLIVAVLWRNAANGEALGKLANIWLLIGAVSGIYTAWFVIVQPFDRSRDIAATIKAQGLQGEHWVAIPEMAGQGVSALTDMRFEKIGRNCMHQFVRWDTPLEMRKPDGFNPWLETAVAERGRFYILTEESLQHQRIREVASISGQVDGKRHRIYVANEDQPAARLDLPDCQPGLRPLADDPAI